MSRPGVTVVVLLAVACVVARGQEEPRAAEERHGVQDEVAIEPIDVALRLPRLRWLPRRDLVPDVTLTTRLPPGSLVVRYAGIQSVVVRRVQGRLRALWHDTLEDAWDAGILADDEYEAQLDRLYAALTDHRAGGRWWERTWLDSLVPRRGGAPGVPFEHQVGERIAFRLGPFRATNELRLQVERVAVLTVDPDAAPLLRGSDPARLAREHAWVIREARDQDDPPILLEEGPEDPSDRQGLAPPVVRTTLALPDPVLLRARWRLTLRPSVSMRLSERASELVRDLRLRANLELYRGTSEVRLFSLQLVLRYRPDGDEVTVGLELVLLTW